ncbi:MAG TPA: hypothetical protein VEU09_12020, partial [Candidatus Binatia bacterium]|nr:hypothetical protein [Candidatus Binatia bacterium]
MAFSLRKTSRLRQQLGDVGVDFLQYGLASLTRILPHVETGPWEVEEKQSKTVANFVDANKRQLRLDLGLELGDSSWKICGSLQRRRVPAGVGSISRTISLRERDIVRRILESLSHTLGPNSPDTRSSLSALRPSFDERIVGRHLTQHHDLEFELSEWLAALRQLAEQTYENKALAFGCVIDPTKSTKPDEKARFPLDFIQRKRFR